MNLQLLYHWQAMVSKHFSSFTVWQQKRLTLGSHAVITGKARRLIKTQDE